MPTQLLESGKMVILCELCGWILWVGWVFVGDGGVGSGSMDCGCHQLSENICFV
jgi:hypothetical protein